MIIEAMSDKLTQANSLDKNLWHMGFRNGKCCWKPCFIIIIVSNQIVQMVGCDHLISVWHVFTSGSWQLTQVQKHSPFADGWTALVTLVEISTSSIIYQLVTQYGIQAIWWYPLCFVIDNMCFRASNLTSEWPDLPEERGWGSCPLKCSRNQRNSQVLQVGVSSFIGHLVS